MTPSCCSCVVQLKCIYASTSLSLRLSMSMSNGCRYLNTDLKLKIYFGHHYFLFLSAVCMFTRKTVTSLHTDYRCSVKYKGLHLTLVYVKDQFIKFTKGKVRLDANWF